MTTSDDIREQFDLSSQVTFSEYQHDAVTYASMRKCSFFTHINILRRLWEYAIMFICLLGPSEILVVGVIFDQVFISIYSILFLFDLIFLFDLFVVRNTVTVHRGQLVRTPDLFKQFYGKWYVYIHLISSIPLGWIGIVVKNRIVYIVLSLNKILRLYRGFKAYKTTTKLLPYIGSVLSILPILYLMLFSINLFAFAFTVNAQVNGFENSFLHQFYDRKFNITQLYFTSLYFIMTTILTIGYGDISPTTTTEIVLAILAQLFGVTIQAILTSNLVAILIDPEENEYVQHYKVVQDFLRFKELDNDQRKVIRNYCQYKWDKTGGFGNITKILGRVPPSLRCTIKLEIISKLFNITKSFRTLNRNQLHMLADIILFKDYSPDDIIIREGEVADKLIFLKTGTIDVIVGGQVVMTHSCNEDKAIGEYEMCTGSINPMTMRVVTFLETWIIKIEDLLKLMDKKRRIRVKVVSSLLTFYPNAYDEITYTLIPNENERMLFASYWKQY
ncbi:cation channel family protein [Histomonas meleagridis]|uniref:cation channel family protein n=1 Tax=Histomonas meleagridis TaxID=135588 RepID=UPI003559A238|nr:cation channel family protein [Histomonas meleagridis]KAH0803827.1 cation channel family protein [Histomonas meleagridis]